MAPTNKHPYTKEQLLDALSRVRSGELSLNKASKIYKIPYATLGDKYRGRRPIHCQDRHLLQPLEEERLVTWLIESAKRGFGKTRVDIRETVKDILDARGATAKSKDNRPSKQWFKDFFLRHPELCDRTPLALGKEWALVSNIGLASWFADMRSYLDKEDPTLLTSPHRIFNADEMGFSLCPKAKKVIAQKGSKHLYSLSSNTKHNITVMGCCSASGKFLPPLLIFPYKRMPSFNVLQGFEEAFFQITGNGWINTQVFYTWMRDCFVPSVAEIQKPVVLFVDGHSSHTSSVETLDLCRENGVVLYCLKSHASHLIQPLDQAVFGAMKNAWESETKRYFARMGESVSVRSFASVLKPVWEATTRPETAFNGFAKSGIFPFNPSRVLSSDKLVPSLTFTKNQSYQPILSASAQQSHEPTSSTSASAQQSHEPTPSTSDSAQPQTGAPIATSSTSTTATTKQTTTTSPHEDLKKLLEFTALAGPENFTKFWENYFEGASSSTDIDTSEFKQLLEKVIKPSVSQTTPMEPPSKKIY